MTKLGCSLLLICLALPTDGWACACYPHTVREDLDRAATVYFARLTAAKWIEPSGEDVLGHFEVAFTVLEVLKGSPKLGDSRNLLFLRCAVPLTMREAGKTTRCWGSDWFDGSDWRKDQSRKNEMRRAVRHRPAA